jgi:hypothetical protein
MRSDYAAVVLMTRAMPAIQQMAPNVAIERVSNSELALPSLGRGDIDLLLIAAIEHGSPRTPFMKFGDEASLNDRSVFGAIDRRVVPANRPGG